MSISGDRRSDRDDFFESKAIRGHALHGGGASGAKGKRLAVIGTVHLCIGSAWNTVASYQYCMGPAELIRSKFPAPPG